MLVHGNIPMQRRSEAVLILGELYRRNNEWEFRFVSRGFNAGLTSLAEHFGVDISGAESPAPETKPINLSKIHAD